MTTNTVSKFVCAAVAVAMTTFSFAEVATVQSVDFEYETAKPVELRA